MQIAFVVPENMDAGMILMWSGTIATIPAGFVFCDGNNGTPDLRDRFIVCAKQDDAGVAKTNLTGALTQSGGAANHTHTFNAGSHNHLIPSTKFNPPIGADDNLPDTLTNNTVVSGVTGNQNNQPPYFSLAYIMKT